ncbi:MAG: phenylacetate--CoA ligase family protein [Candidatus Hodarchaeales archaeon]|jgi:phenylacetate-coenzyme A ligase PaaK-like adenylate-forming protein
MSSDILVQNQAQKLAALHEIVLAAKEKSPLYKEKYQAIEISPDFDLTAFGTLPLLTRDDYYKGMKPMDFSLLIGGIPGTYIFTSGGTTGDVKLTAWNQDFVENWVDECYRSLATVGLDATDTVINLFFPGIWATHTLINKSLEKAGCRIVPLGGKISLELLLEYIKRLQVTALIGVPSFIVRLAEYIETLPDSERSGINLKKIWWAGEFLSPNQTEFLKKSLNCQVHPFIYSSTDTGTIGMKCEHCGTNQYHIAESIYLETLDPDTAEAVPVGAPGEFVVTSLVNEKAPCIRYRVGDMGIINDAPCPCGNSTPLFTLKGRADDEVKVAGYLINPNIVQQGMEHFSNLSRNFQLVVEEHGKKAKLTVICEVLPSFAIKSDPDLPERVASHVAASYDILEELIAREYCLPLEIQLVPPDTIPRNPRTGKIKRVRDLR